MSVETAKKSYLQWLSSETKTKWWHDSADLDELALGMEHGAVGATVNPVLVSKAVQGNPAKWQSVLKSVESMEGDTRIEEVARCVTTKVAEKLFPIYEQTKGEHGYACAQVNPSLAGDRQPMLELARRFNKWADNIAVKLPVTTAGLDVLEICVAEGITVTLTVSFTVPQVIAIAEAYRRGLKLAEEKGNKPGKCFAVIMIGRIDDYLRDVAHDRKANVSESDIRQAGIAISKRAYSIFQQRGYEAVLIIAALRGTYHMTELAGADLIMSIHPTYQKQLLLPDVPHEERIDIPVAEEVVERLSSLDEFVRAYDPDGLKPEEFITFGVSQKTLSQFYNAGWKAV